MIASSTVAAEVATSGFMQGDGKRREYYELRRYQFLSGPHVNLAHDYFREALVPALNRLGIRLVGVFNLTIGPEAPSVYLLMPCSSLDTLIAVDSALDRDAAYLKAGDAFLNAPARDPAYVRVDSSLLLAFEGMPLLAVPAAEKRPRMFELRTYESPSDQDHKRKVEEFNSGEMDSFRKAGFWGVFFASSLIGSRLPNLTYMLGFNDLADRDRKWDAFRAEPGWTKLNASTRYTFEAIVSNTTNTILTATPYSQI